MRVDQGVNNNKDVSQVKTSCFRLKRIRREKELKFKLEPLVQCE